MKFSELKGDAYDYDNAVIEECATKFATLLQNKLGNLPGDTEVTLTKAHGLRVKTTITLESENYVNDLVTCITQCYLDHNLTHDFIHYLTTGLADHDYRVLYTTEITQSGFKQKMKTIFGPTGIGLFTEPRIQELLLEKQPGLYFDYEVESNHGAYEVTIKRGNDSQKFDISPIASGTFEQYGWLSEHENELIADMENLRNQRKTRKVSVPIELEPVLADNIDKITTLYVAPNFYEPDWSEHPAYVKKSRRYEDCVEVAMDLMELTFAYANGKVVVEGVLTTYQAKLLRKYLNTSYGKLQMKEHVFERAIESELTNIYENKYAAQLREFVLKAPLKVYAQKLDRVLYELNVKPGKIALLENNTERFYIERCYNRIHFDSATLYDSFNPSQSYAQRRQDLIEHYVQLFEML